MWKKEVLRLDWFKAALKKGCALVETDVTEILRFKGGLNDLIVTTSTCHGPYP